MLWTSCNRRCAGGAVGCMHSPVGLLGPLGGSPSWGLSRAAFLLQFHCCGSNNSQDWQDSEWIRSDQAGGRVVPDSCCKTVVPGCGQRDHASNIYKVEVGRWGPGLPGGGLRGPGPGCWWGGWCGHTRRGLQRRGGWTCSPSVPLPVLYQGGCITKLETFIQEHLRVIGAVGVGIACVQVWGWGGTGPGGCRGHRVAGAVLRSHRLCAPGLRHGLHVLSV